MWNIISMVVFALEVLLLVGYIVGRICNRKINKTVLFLSLVFVMNLALYLVPFLYRVIELGESDNLVFGMLECITGSIKLFLGEVETDKVSDFALAAPNYVCAYLMGTLLALIATISAAIEAFSNTIRNRACLARAMAKPTCDMVLGSCDMALEYARHCDNAVLLIGEDTTREAAVALMEDGYVVWRRNFSVRLLQSRLFGSKTRYNIICPLQGESGLKHIDTFIEYKGSEQASDNIFMYVEVEDGRSDTIRQEVVERSGFEECITTFSRNELLARSFTEEHPVTEHMPRHMFAEDASVKPDSKINVYLLGFSALSGELYRQSIMNNQLVCYRDGAYHVLPVNYYVYDTDVDDNVWMIGGLKRTLNKMSKNSQDYLPMPEMPYNTEIVEGNPYLRDTLSDIADKIASEPSYNYLFVDTGDAYRNINTCSRLRTMLHGAANYHMFVCSDVYARDDENVTYYGDFSKIYNHNVIVNDSLNFMAQMVNQVYVERNLAASGTCPDSKEQVEEIARQKWCSLSYFTMSSNIYAAMNLKLKLNLLGLTFVNDQRADGAGLIRQEYAREERDYQYQEYFVRSKRNALLAQEHARWNAYHLMLEFLPMALKDMEVVEKDDGSFKVKTKDMDAKRHSCLTTFMGLHELGEYQAKLLHDKTGKDYTPGDFDVYCYDEMLIVSAEQLMAELRSSVKRVQGQDSAPESNQE
ncbi:MAG: hypothetical protein IKC38_00815 [Clostridia bacterium]|nr:hypothetical protein [Clostridia bacterium]